MDSKSDRNLDLIDAAIRRLMEESDSGCDKDPSARTESDEGRVLLTKLMSQLEALKGDPAADLLEEPFVDAKDFEGREKAENPGEKPEGIAAGKTDDDIIKELKEVKRQNTITHWLLGIMIVLTLTWQVSEVSLLLRLKDGLSHPFRSVRGMLAGMFKDGTSNGNGNGNGDESPGSNQGEMLPIPTMKMPELPMLDTGSNGKENK